MLTESRLVNANLMGASLSGARLNQTDVTGANFNGADVTGTRLNGLIGEETSTFSKAKNLDRVIR